MLNCDDPVSGESEDLMCTDCIGFRLGDVKISTELPYSAMLMAQISTFPAGGEEIYIQFFFYIPLLFLKSGCSGCMNLKALLL